VGKALMMVLVLAALAGSAWAQTVAVELDGRQAAVAETNLGNLVADALRVQAQAQLAFMPASYLKAAVVPPGPLGAQAQAGLLVYPQDRLVVVSLSGDQVRAALERSVSLEPLPNKGFLQVSGLVFWYDPGVPAGQRVVRMLGADGRPLDPAARYRVAMPHSLARGALGYFRVFNGATLTETNKTIASAFAQYLQSQTQVAPRVEGRIRGIAAR